METIKQKTSTRSWLILILIIFFGLIPRIVDLINSSGIELDGVYYAISGKHFSRGEFVDALKKVVFPPFYPFFIGISHLFISDLELSGRLTSLVFGSLLILLCYFAIKKMYGEKHALYMAFFIAIHPYLIRSSVQVLSESTAVFIFTLSIFLFYFGWIEKKHILIALSGICLGLTYLTRPEYIVYPLPLTLCLIYEKKFKDLLIFLFCFFAVAFPYILYLKFDTGLWVISKKAILAKQQGADTALLNTYYFPVLPFFNIFKNIPSVIYHFFEAMSIPFIIIGILGINKTEKRFRTIAFSLIICHILSLSLITSSTRRFSVGFIPIFIVFCVQGFFWLQEKFHIFKRKMFFWATIFIFIVSSFYQGIVFKNPGRMLNKQAGLFMKTYDPEKKIAARIPLVPFYSNGEWINLIENLNSVSNCDGLIKKLKNIGVEYIVVDEVLIAYGKEKGIDILSEGCFIERSCVANFQHNEEFLKIFRIQNGR